LAVSIGRDHVNAQEKAACPSLEGGFGAQALWLRSIR